jgi:hypothetical protein
MPQQQQQETPEQQQARLARERADAAERELAAFRATEQARRQSNAAITEGLPRVQLERLGGAEEQAQRAQLARELMSQQQAGQRQLLAQQAKQGVRGGAAAAQQSRLQQQIAAQRASQEEQGFLGRRMFNLEQSQREQFSNTAAELARRQLMASLRGQELQAQAAERFGQQQIQAANQGGKIICAELYRQGLMDQATFEADEKFGKHMAKYNPDVMIGYWTLAIPIVRLMRRSSVFTKIVNLFAAPWAKEMAFRVNPNLDGNGFGAAVMFFGVGLCGFLGRVRVRIQAYGSN